MLALSTRSCSVTIDSVAQKIFFVPHPFMFTRIGAPRGVFFEEIEQVYLGFWEESYPDTDEYIYVPRTRRRWSIALALRDGQTVTVAEETTDHRAGETTALVQQQARWEMLAKTVGELVGKPLIHLSGVPGGPYTFVEGIEHILQRRLKQAGRNDLSVNIRGGQDLGIEIVVNGKSYAAIDEVEDEVARNLIQAAIDEWQGFGKG